MLCTYEVQHVEQNANAFHMLQMFPSPTLGAFASQQYSWMPPQSEEQGGGGNSKEEQRQSYPEFSFQTVAPTSEEAPWTTTTFQQPPVPPPSLVRSASIQKETLLGIIYSY
jgi:hypothetical protein